MDIVATDKVDAAGNAEVVCALDEADVTRMLASGDPMARALFETAIAEEHARRFPNGVGVFSFAGYIYGKWKVKK